MIVVKVTYTVESGYEHHNQENIQNFLSDFKKLDSTQFIYSVFQKEGSTTFVHLSQYQNSTIQAELLNTPSFLHFQEQRDKNLSSEPEIEVLTFIGASKLVL